MKRHTESFYELPDEIVRLIKDAESTPHKEQLRVKEYSDRIPVLKGKKHVIIPWSGGLDSTVQLLMALESSLEVTTVFFDYGQSYVEKEEEATEKIIEILSNSEYSQQHVGHIRLDIAWLENQMAELFPGEWEHIFPMRNLIILLLAANVIDISDRELWFGAVQGEIPYSGGDKSEVFIRYMREYLMKKHDVVLRTPLATLTKGDMVFWASKYPERMEVLKASVSCFDSASVSQCSKCQACFNRAVGFINGGAADESGIDYETPEMAEFAESYKKKLNDNSYYSYRRRKEISNFIEYIKK